MHRLRIFALLLIAICAKPINAQPSMGINLAGPCDWNTELPFVDVFRQSRPWISQRPGQPWGGGPALELNELGWVTRLEPGCFAETLMLTDLDGHYPKGRYTVLYEGAGRVEITRGRIVERAPGRIVFEVHPTAGISLQLHEIDPADPVRNIRVIMPGFEDTYLNNPWHPRFLERWQDFAAVRFMDFMHTNNSTITRWEQRPTPQHQTFSQRGVAVEYLVDFANRADLDPWFCMPHEADDEFIRQFARYVKRHLNPDRRVYVEWSNETWNSIFQQHRYAAVKGQQLGLANQPWAAAWQYTARRSVEVFRLWEQEFGEGPRLVRVLATQSANPYIAEQMLAFPPVAQHADALAIAPYLGLHLTAERVDDVLALGVDGLLDQLEEDVLPQVTSQHIRRHKAVADKFGLQLIAYEAGQHLVGVGAAVNQQPLTDLLQQVNAHPRMATIYRQYFDAWQQEGGGLLAHFSSISAWSKWGSWGLMQYYDQDPQTQPKMHATFQQARRW